MKKSASLPKYKCGDGKVFNSEAAAVAHANAVFARKGVVIAVEKVK